MRETRIARAFRKANNGFRVVGAWWIWLPFWLPAFWYEIKKPNEQP